ncbi:MAG: alanyl-tRNA editing protein [Bryobacteraceae bacterium]
MTNRLYYYDSYLTDFQAQVVDSSTDRKRIYLDRTAFYPTSGGQPFDLGKLGGVPVTEILDEDDRIAHLLSAPLEDTEAACQVDWIRRFDHMQQHTGQHLLSAVFLELLNAPTVSFHLGADSATIDLGCPALDSEQIRKIEDRANQVVFENRPVTISFEDQAQYLGLRKPSERPGELRVISIQDLDRSACGGTHVRATGEIGPILLRARSEETLRELVALLARSIEARLACIGVPFRAHKYLAAVFFNMPIRCGTHAARGADRR